MYLNCVCDRGCASDSGARTPLGELTALPQTPQLDLKGPRRGREDDRSGAEVREKKGEEGIRGGDEREGLTLFPLKKFLLAPMMVREINHSAPSDP